MALPGINESTPPPTKLLNSGGPGGPIPLTLDTLPWPLRCPSWLRRGLLHPDPVARQPCRRPRHGNLRAPLPDPCPRAAPHHRRPWPQAPCAPRKTKTSTTSSPNGTNGLPRSSPTASTLPREGRCLPQPPPSRHLPARPRRQKLSLPNHAPAGGATPGIVLAGHQVVVSIHAPTGGATCGRWSGREIEQVSIHAPAGGATPPESSGLS